MGVLFKNRLYICKSFDFCMKNLWYESNFNCLKYPVMAFKEFIENYEAPVVEVIEVEVEKGFAATNESWEEGDEIPL